MTIINKCVVSAIPIIKETNLQSQIIGLTICRQIIVNSKTFSTIKDINIKS